jgi:molybdate transport system substrate-binding protein
MKGAIMKLAWFRAAATLCVASFACTAVAAADLKVLCSLAMKPAMADLAPAFEKASGHKVTVEYGTIADLRARVEKGERADILLVSDAVVKSLEQQGRLTGVGVPVAKSGIGVMVRKDAARPQVDSVDALNRTLIKATSIGHADPARGGAISTYVAAMLDRMDIAAEIQPKRRVYPPSDFSRVASGEIEVAFGGTSEILSYPGVDFVGPLPAALQNYTTYVAALPAGGNATEGAAFVRFMASPSGAAILGQRGFGPP